MNLRPLEHEPSELTNCSSLTQHNACLEKINNKQLTIVYDGLKKPINGEKDNNKYIKNFKNR